MNASNADEVCDLTPIPSAVVYKNDEARAPEEAHLSNESELFRIVATILVFVAWVYLIVRGYLDYEANRAEAPDDGSQNVVEGDHRLHELFNNANEFDPPPDNAAEAGGPGQEATAARSLASTEPRENDASPVARQPAPPIERRRRQRSNDVMSVDPLAPAIDLDEALPSAAADDARADPGSVQDQDIDGAVKPKKPLRNVRKFFVRVQKPEDSRSKEPETSDEDLVPSYESKTETTAPTDEFQTKATAVAIVTLKRNTSDAATQQVAVVESVVDGCGLDTQSTCDVQFPSDNLEDFQAILSTQQPLENDLEPSCGRNAENHCLKRITLLNDHGTRFDEDLIAEAEAKAESTVLEAVRRDDSGAREVTQPVSRRIVDLLNTKLLEQLTTDLVRGLEEQTVSEEGLRQEIDVQARARREALRCYSKVAEQVRRFGIRLRSAHSGTQAEEQEQNQQRNCETADQGAIQDNTAKDMMP